MNLAELSCFIVFGLVTVGLTHASEVGRRPTVPEAATRGLQNLQSQPYSFANPFLTLSEDTFSHLWMVWPKELQEELKTSPTSFRKLALKRYGLLEAPFENKGAPLGFVVTAKKTWEANCLACHAGTIAGKTVIGRGNHRLDTTTLIADTAGYRFATNDFKDLSPAEEFIYKNGLAQLGALPTLTHSSVGTMNVWVTGSVEGTLRDNNLNQLQSPRQDITFPAPTENTPPPWWNSKWKARYGWDGFAPMDSRTIMLSTLTFGNSSDLIKSWDNQFADVLQYIDSIAVPAYPFPIDQQLAKKGAEVFAQTCASCHGTYTAGELTQYPEKLISLKLVGTDPVRAESGVDSGYKKFLNESWMGRNGSTHYLLDPPKAYIAPPLRGIWAAAPYFHNGSVPNLYGVLFPAARPKVWIIKDVDAYDTGKVGLVYDSLESTPPGLRPDQASQYFDTSVSSKGNAGHNFADDAGLTEAEKLSVLEFLKTI